MIDSSLRLMAELDERYGDDRYKRKDEERERLVTALDDAAPERREVAELRLQVFDLRENVERLWAALGMVEDRPVQVVHVHQKE